MNPLKVLVSVIHDTESIIHKAVYAKEAELSKEVEGDLVFLLITYIHTCIYKSTLGIRSSHFFLLYDHQTVENCDNYTLDIIVPG